MGKAFFNWSSGKDSALALYRALNSDRFSVESLFSVLNRNKKIAMHEIGIKLLTRQVQAIGLPFVTFYFDHTWSDTEYESAMMKYMDHFKAQSITTALYGDLHSEQLRKTGNINATKPG